MTDFQSSAGAQGRQFAAQCDLLLEINGFQLTGRRIERELGVEIDQEALAPAGHRIWFEYKGSLQGSRPGLLRTDTLKKAIANGALIATLAEHPPYVVLTSHLPIGGAGLGMLRTALAARYLFDVICINDPADVRRLANL